MHFPYQLFENAGLSASDVARLFGVSRVTGYRWLQATDRKGNRGVGVNIFLQPRVSRGIEELRRALAAGDFPDEGLRRLTPVKRNLRIKSILRKHRAKR